MLATPYETVSRSEDAADRRRIAGIVTELGVVEIIVGLPLALSGAHTAATADAIAFAEALVAEVDVPVRLVDERLTTVSAHSALRASGKNSKQARPVVDQAAAAIILQHALDAEHASGRPPGHHVEPSIGH